jgi:hypothetical protein
LGIGVSNKKEARNMDIIPNLWAPEKRRGEKRPGIIEILCAPEVQI